MRPRFLAGCILIPALFAATATPARAWNSPGHEIISAIAWQNLSPEAREKITALLKAHPDYADQLTHDSTPAGPPRDLEAFLTAATWPDLVRTPGKPQYRYNHPDWHFVDFPLVIGDLPKPPEPEKNWKPGDNPTNALQAFAKNLADLKNPDLSAADRAIALCWIEHLVGDIHQPLHAVSLFDAQFPSGDKGGNSQMLSINGKPMNLHAIWDDMLGTDMDPAAVHTLAARIIKEYPRSDLTTALAQSDFAAWAQESFAAARQTVYLDGTLKTMTAESRAADRTADPPELPAGYMAKAMGTAEERAALAGYRLADLLNSLFPS